MPRDADGPDAADIVLVHGTTQAPSGWQLLSAELTQRGHRVQSVDLPVDLPELCAEDYAEIIGKQCGVVHRPVVLAHSAAGLLLPSVSRRLNASHLVWLSATIPDPTGRISFAEEVRSHGPEMFNAEWLALTEPPVKGVRWSHRGRPIEAAGLDILAQLPSALQPAQHVDGHDRAGIGRTRRDQ